MICIFLALNIYTQGMAKLVVLVAELLAKGLRGPMAESSVMIVT